MNDLILFYMMPSDGVTFSFSQIAEVQAYSIRQWFVLLWAASWYIRKTGSARRNVISTNIFIMILPSYVYRDRA